jgi:hypothetical protein
MTASSGSTCNATTGLPTGSNQSSLIEYDVQGRRTLMTSSNGTALGFIHAGNMEIADLDMEGAPITVFCVATSPGQALMSVWR